jgi:transposase
VTSVSFSDVSWDLIYDFLDSCDGIYTKNEKTVKNFVEAVLYITRSGVQWRLLPAEYGNWNTVYRRFAEWSEKGVWKAMFLHFSSDKDLEYIMIDATVIKAHACSAGAKKGANKLLVEASEDIPQNSMQQ